MQVMIYLARVDSKLKVVPLQTGEVEGEVRNIGEWAKDWSYNKECFNALFKQP